MVRHIQKGPAPGLKVVTIFSQIAGNVGHFFRQKCNKNKLTQTIDVSNLNVLVERTANCKICGIKSLNV